MQSPPDAGVSAEDWAARERELQEMEARLVAVVAQNVSPGDYVLMVGLEALTSRVREHRIPLRALVSYIDSPRLDREPRNLCDCCCGSAVLCGMSQGEWSLSAIEALLREKTLG